VSNQNQKRVFVGNLDYKATESDVARAFQQLGVQVDKVRIPLNDEDRPKGYAFVDIAPDCDLSVEEIIETVSGHVFNGRPCRLDKPREQERRGGNDRQRDNRRDRNERGGRGGGGRRRDSEWGD
jgi:RNA recognition motif-containing protein